MTTPTIGDQELALLNLLAAEGPLSVGEAAERFGGPRGLARSTVLTMMERLREKGWLARSKRDGVYVYASTRGPARLLADVVGGFVERALGGSVSPFVAYLAERDELSEDDARVLEETLVRLRAKRDSEGER